MKRTGRLIALLLSILIMGGILACTQISPNAPISRDIELIDTFDDIISREEMVLLSLDSDAIALSEIPIYANLVYTANPVSVNASPLNTVTAGTAGFTIPIPSASGSQHNTNQRAAIDFSNSADGYVMARVTRNTSTQIRVTITGPDNVLYQYRLNGSGTWEVFPLSAGNGRYVISVLEQIEGTRFAVLNTSTITVNLRDEFAPFLRPNQFVNFSKDSAVTKKAAELAGNITGVYARVEAIYNFVIKNITYDRTFAREVQNGMHSGYVPNVDTVLANKKGICFDYASLMTAMLRSLGIPTRLVIGYAGEQYHAWIDVFSEADGWINNIIHFDGRSWNLMDPTFAATGNQSADVMRFIGDGKNYSPRFIR
ncbi:MAG: transglutaminase-like domain-containing protein [Oscillospiraceae bacterium]|nr:transglutaminase-like domain-containing protein [Oscillospiraceae bacterium]